MCVWVHFFLHSHVSRKNWREKKGGRSLAITLIRLFLCLSLASDPLSDHTPLLPLTTRPPPPLSSLPLTSPPFPTPPHLQAAQTIYPFGCFEPSFLQQLGGPGASQRCGVCCMLALSSSSPPPLLYPEQGAGGCFGQLTPPPPPPPPAFLFR